MMKKVLVRSILALLAMAFLAGSASAVEVFNSKTELILNDADQTQPGYVLFAGPVTVDGVPTLAIINTDGEVVHSIDVPALSGINYAYMLENGNILIVGSSPGKLKNSAIMGNGPGATIMEVTWDGTEVFRFKGQDAEANYSMHHDMRKIWNKTLGEYTYIFLAWEHYTEQDALKLGFNPETGSGQQKSGVWSPDVIYEVNQAGEIIWRWSFADHLVTEFADNVATETFISDGPLARPVSPAVVGHPSDYPGKLDVNFRHGSPGKVGPYKDWTHCNSLDYNPEKGHIALNAKHMNEMYVIDHDNTFVSTSDWNANWAAAASEAGDFLYRFGNPASYVPAEDLGEAEQAYYYAGHHQFWGAHNIHWIGGAYYPGWDTLPGEGNFIIFDNSCWNPVERLSRIVEWNSHVDSTLADTGDYVDQRMAGYNDNVTMSKYNVSNQVEWMFKSKRNSFYSSYISGMQRMPNGNTFVDSGAHGHFFEVTPGGDVVWEYINPIAGGGIQASIRDGESNSTFRAYKIPAGHPGLRGKSLIPMGTFTKPVNYTGFGFGGGIGGSGGGGAGSGGSGGGAGY